MQQLQNKRIILGVTGGIAAYKSAELVRLLHTWGAEVKVVMTPAACDFITPLTFQALSHNPVHRDLLDTDAEAAMGHITLARWADLVLVAPATADFIARLASGQANDLLTTLCLATRAPLCLAPAMNQHMWGHPQTQQNCHTLRERDIHLWGPAEGSQACGDVGLGRMLEPALLVEQIAARFVAGQLSGVKVMLTAGPTQESLDPARYLSNRSSGKMGYALATAAIEAGAAVTLISGPVSLPVPDRVQHIAVTSAQDMYRAVHQHVAGHGIFIGCAAVCDYRPETVLPHKLKKEPQATDEVLTLRLVRNPDVIASVSALAQPPFIVGFAAETQNVLDYAADKLKQKCLDLIVANNVADQRIGFNSDDNAVTVLGDDLQETFPRAAKTVLSRQLLTLISRRYHQWRSNSSTQ